MRHTGNTLKAGAVILSAALLAVIWGCSSAADGAPKFDSGTGHHPEGWMKVHYAEYLKSPDQCRTCHGSPTDPKAAGGVSGVSCLTCHPHGPNHPTGWAAPAMHGRAGAQAAPGTFSGFAYCAKCHGADYVHGIGNATSCKTCHTKAPHPSKPWLGSTATAPNHDKTELSNAPACFTCHANGANSTLVPKTPAPAGTVPGCFNNTMCHGREL